MSTSMIYLDCDSSSPLIYIYCNSRSSRKDDLLRSLSDHNPLMSGPARMESSNLSSRPRLIYIATVSSELHHCLMNTLRRAVAERQHQATSSRNGITFSSLRHCIHMKILFPLNVIHRFLAFALRRETGSGWSGLVHRSGKSFCLRRGGLSRLNVVALPFPFRHGGATNRARSSTPRIFIRPEEIKKMPKLFSLSRALVASPLDNRE